MSPQSETHHLPVPYTFLLSYGPPAVLRKEGGEGREGGGEVGGEREERGKERGGRGEGRERKRGRGE